MGFRVDDITAVVNTMAVLWTCCVLRLINASFCRFIVAVKVSKVYLI